LKLKNSNDDRRKCPGLKLEFDHWQNRLILKIREQKMNPRILIVDDEKAILLAFKKLLRSPDIVVDAAETIDDAEKLLKENIYNVVIADLRLTGVDGEEGLKIIKNVKEFCFQTEVILVTGYGSSAVMEQARALGAAFYFEKPVSAVVLKKALKSLNIG
jgi:DNA-binding NtrC family response regulator